MGGGYLFCFGDEMKRILFSAGIAVAAIILLVAVLAGLGAAEAQAATPAAVRPIAHTQAVTEAVWTDLFSYEVLTNPAGCYINNLAAGGAGSTSRRFDGYARRIREVGCGAGAAIKGVNASIGWISGVESITFRYSGDAMPYGSAPQCPAPQPPSNYPIPDNPDSAWLGCQTIGDGTGEEFRCEFDSSTGGDFRLRWERLGICEGAVVGVDNVLGFNVDIIAVNGITVTVPATDCVPIIDVSIAGPITITQGKLGTFNAYLSPGNATTPYSFTWNTQNTAPQPPGGETQPGENSPTVNDPYFGFYGAVPGTYTVTVEASNCGGSASDSVTVTVVSGFVPLPMPECTPPVLFLKCTRPPWDAGVGPWIDWLWCNQGGWFRYFVGIIEYTSCLVARPLVVVFNGLGEILYILYVNLGDKFLGFVLFLLNYFMQFGAFLEMLVNSLPVCMEGTFDWIVAWVNVSAPGFANFIAMAIPESTMWLSTLLSWFATDFLTASFGAILQVMATVINNAGATMQFLTEQFAATVVDAVRMIGYVLLMIQFVLDLLTSLVTGLNAALSSDSVPELYDELTFFWRGMDFFEEVVGDTPLALLNLVALGAMGVSLIYWTIGQVAGMIDDLMRV